MLGLLHQDLGESETLAHAARKRRDPLAAGIGQPDPDHRPLETIVDLAPRQPGEPPGIGEIVAR